MKYIFILLALYAQTCNADKSDCGGQLLTYKAYYQIRDNVTANRDFHVLEKDTYILITTKSTSSYAFTNKHNPAHPSYLKMKMSFKGNKPHFDIRGAHSGNCNAYLKFKSDASNSISAYMKDIMPWLELEQQQDTVEQTGSEIK